MNAMNEKPRRRLATVNAALRYVGCGRTQLYALVNSGEIVAVKMHGRTLIDLDSVDRFHAALPRIMPNALEVDQ